MFIPFMCFIEDIEHLMGAQNGCVHNLKLVTNLKNNVYHSRSCQLHRFITQYVSEIYLKRKSEEIIDQIEGAVRAADAWKSTVLMDYTADYKPLLIVSQTLSTEY